MATKELYKRFIALCEKWPKDESKAGRDFGEYFRSKMADKFPHGMQSYIENAKQFELRLAALERIANNIYFNEDILKRSSSTGLESWVCTQAISNEGISSMQQYEESSIIDRLRESLKFKFEKRKDDTSN